MFVLGTEGLALAPS